jgi:NADPH-dependent curcumin reductase CurA
VTRADFEVIRRDVPDVGDGQVLVRSIYLSLDPYQRMRMSGRSIQHPLGSPMPGEVVGEITGSRAPGWPEGTIVAGFLTWSSYCVASPDQLRRVDAARAPLSTAVHALGLAGVTAYFGLFDVGRPTPGETVFVSSAAGSVGSLAGQLAKLAGCRVVGSTGSDRKAARCVALGYDAVVNYNDPELRGQVATACPDGIDIYFDNVGGSFSDVVFDHLNARGRVLICGDIAAYEGGSAPTGPRREFPLLRKRARIEGFSSVDFNHRAEEAFSRVAAWIRDGRVSYREEIVDGLENAPGAFGRLFTGEIDGKLMVRVGPEPESG